MEGREERSWYDCSLSRWRSLTAAMSLYPGTHCPHRGEWYVRHTCIQAFLVYQVLAGGEECEPILREEWKT